MIKDDPAHLEYNHQQSRRAEYPTPEEWIIALVQKEVDDDSRILVGVNKFADEIEAKQKLLRIDDSLGRKQEKAIKALRKSRDNKKTDSALSKLQAAAETDQNLMPFILDSVKTYATTGEISNKLREVFGEYRPKEIF